jgi:hypothetical protein
MLAAKCAFAIPSSRPDADPPPGPPRARTFEKDREGASAQLPNPAVTSHPELESQEISHVIAIVATGAVLVSADLRRGLCAAKTKPRPATNDQLPPGRIDVCPVELSQYPG